MDKDLKWSGGLGFFYSLVENSKCVFAQTVPVSATRSPSLVAPVSWWAPFLYNQLLRACLVCVFFQHMFLFLILESDIKTHKLDFGCAQCCGYHCFQPFQRTGLGRTSVPANRSIVLKIKTTSRPLTLIWNSGFILALKWKECFKTIMLLYRIPSLCFKDFVSFHCCLGVSKFIM